jgi:hypothetical protein
MSPVVWATRWPRLALRPVWDLVIVNRIVPAVLIVKLTLVRSWASP